MNYTDNLKLRKPEGGEYYDVEDFNKNSDLLDAAVNNKADKPCSATAGNFPMLDAGGNLGDSGKSASSFAAANHGHDTAYAPIAHVSDAAVHIGADEKVAIAAVASKADRTYVDSVLSTKANVTNAMTALGVTSVIENGILQKINGLIAGQGGYFSSTDASDRPMVSFGNALIVPSGFGWANGFVLWVADNNMGFYYMRNYRDGAWKGDWYKLATATPPQKYDVPIGYGWSRIDGTKYCKSQDGKVTIGLKIGMGGVAIPAGNYTVGMMPEGYRPAPGDDNSGVGTDSSDTNYQGLPVQMWVLSSGGIGVRIPKDIVASPTAGVMGKITYWAAQ